MPHLRVGPKNDAGTLAAEDPAVETIGEDTKVEAQPETPTRRKTTAAQPNELKLHCTAHLPSDSGVEPKSIGVCLDFSGQHTLTWDKTLTFEGEELPAGSCNLYVFPACTDAKDGLPFAPTGSALTAFTNLLIALALDEDCLVMRTVDQVGAYVMHAITVCNTPQSLSVSWEVYKAVPRLLLQLHEFHRAGFPLFFGESTLHICCVNKREDLLVDLIDLAIKELPSNEVHVLFKSQGTGVFFHEVPMRWYGGSPLAYACCFGLRRGILAMLQSGHVSLNDPDQCDKLTGCMPIHATVACGLSGVYEWLINGLPEVYRADPTMRTRVGKMLTLNVHDLNPMQLSVQLGDHDMFKHILRKQCSILWVWGPVTQYSIDLEGVDSAGDGGGDVMELVGRLDASRATTELLLDSFMQGFLYDLFMQKWRGFGWKLHYGRRFIDVAILIMTVLMSMDLKLHASYETQKSLNWVAIVILILIVIGIEEEVRTAYLHWQNTQGVGDAKVAWSDMMKSTLSFMHLHGATLLLFSYIFMIGSCCIVLSNHLETEAEIYAFNYNAEWGNTTSSGRQLRGGSAVNSEGLLITIFGDKDEVTGLTWFFMAFAIFNSMLYTAFAVFTPFESLNIFMLSVSKVLKKDLKIFLVLFGFFLLTFYLTLFVLYPRSTIDLPLVDSFNRWEDAMQRLLELALTGSATTINLNPVLFGPLSTMQVIDFSLWFMIYYLFVLISLILLLNLLIAMLSFTFETVREESTLQCRTAFVRCLLRLELQAAAIGMITRVGDHVGDKYVYNFRSVEENPEGNGAAVAAAAGEDPFAIPDGGPLARIERELANVKAKLETMQAASSAGSVVEALGNSA